MRRSISDGMHVCLVICMYVSMYVHMYCSVAGARGKFRNPKPPVTKSHRRSKSHGQIRGATAREPRPCDVQHTTASREVVRWDCGQILWLWSLLREPPTGVGAAWPQCDGAAAVNLLATRPGALRVSSALKNPRAGRWERPCCCPINESMIITGVVCRISLCGPGATRVSVVAPGPRPQLLPPGSSHSQDSQHGRR